jgi:hypothetical protein
MHPQNRLALLDHTGDKRHTRYLIVTNKEIPYRNLCFIDPCTSPLDLWSLFTYIADEQRHDVMVFSAEAQDLKGWELNVIAGKI